MKKLHFVNGACVAEFEDGYLAAVVAYERGAEAAERWADEQHVRINSFNYVCGWEAADELLDEWGFELGEVW